MFSLMTSLALTLQLASHEPAAGFFGRLLAVNDRPHLIRDRRVHAEPRSKPAGRAGRLYSFGDLSEFGDDLVQWTAGGESEPDPAVS